MLDILFDFSWAFYWIVINSEIQSNVCNLSGQATMKYVCAEVSSMKPKLEVRPKRMNIRAVQQALMKGWDVLLKILLW